MDTNDPSTPKTSGPPFGDRAVPPVVGIGASAGGLAALRAFFGHVPDDSGLAFVVVVHLAPERESHLAAVLRPHVRMPVEQVTETTLLQANHVYVIPPNCNLSTIDTHLRLTPLEELRRERAPIDHFFRTLAKTHDAHAIGVILSGTGTDGALGMKDIKEYGGLTVVQDPSEAEYDGMPRSAIATGIVDLVLPLGEIAGAVLDFARTEPRVRVPAEGDEVGTDTRHHLQKMFAQIRAYSGRDFTRYKRSTVLRRITRRMQMHRLEELPGYLELLRRDPQEVHALADDLLVTVTSFFRDPEVFARLENDIVPRLFGGKGADDDLRVWSVGCASGEEAYSLTMLLLEEAMRRDSPPQIQVFASDLHEQSLDLAREGFYSGDIEQHVSPERLRRWFQKEDAGYRVCKELREIVVFAPHNLLADPPFSRLDVIACRNLLIYLQHEAQNDTVDLFHYALRADGFLVLGSSETVDRPDLFRTEDKKACIYRKRNVPAPEPRLPVFPLRRAWPHHAPLSPEQPTEPIGYGALHQRMVERYAPPSMLVSPEDKVVHLSERAGRYLVHPGGEMTTSASKLVREELRVELRALLHEAREQGEASRSKPLPVPFDGETRDIVLHVRPSLEAEQKGFMLIIFDEQKPVEPGADAAGSPADARAAARTQEIERERDRSRQRLQAIIEEYETGQEEMRAANEELQSANEELRSTMEELETSKEELQSMNEELQTLNQEYRHKVEELDQLSADLQNFLAATDIATLFLDRELRIVRFTPKIVEIFNVRPGDRGRPLSDLTHGLEYPGLRDDAAAVMKRLMPIHREIGDEKGRWYVSRLLPYRTSGDHIGGVVLTLVDMTDRKRMESEVLAAKDYAEQIIAALPEPLLVLTADLRVRSCTPAFCDHFRVLPEQTEGRKIYELGNSQWDIPELRRLLEEVLPANNVFEGYRVDHVFESLGRRIMLLNGRRLDHRQLILLGIRDITARFLIDQRLRRSEELYRLAAEAGQVGTWDLDLASDDCRVSDQMARLVAFESESEAEPGGAWEQVLPLQRWMEAVHPDDFSRVHAALTASRDEGAPFDVEFRIRWPDGSVRWLQSTGRVSRDPSSDSLHLYGATVDVTERKRTRQR